MAKTKVEIKKEQLWWRLHDLLTGAAGGNGFVADQIAEDETICMEPTVMHRWMAAIKAAFSIDDSSDSTDDRRYILKHWNLDEFDNLDKAVEFCWRQGLRP